MAENSVLPSCSPHRNQRRRTFGRNVFLSHKASALREPCVSHIRVFEIGWHTRLVDTLECCIQDR